MNKYVFDKKSLLPLYELHALNMLKFECMFVRQSDNKFWRFIMRFIKEYFKNSSTYDIVLEALSAFAFVYLCVFAVAMAHIIGG